jgi:hypothetical protein
VTDGHQGSNCKECNMNAKLSLSTTLRIFTAIASAALPAASGIAAPPGSWTSPPPVVDIAYTASSAISGLKVSASGAASGDVVLWSVSRQLNLQGQPISWNPDGTWLAWYQDTDKNGTHAIVAGQPGTAPRTVLTFPSGGITRRPGIDTMAWGRGCNGGSVIVFLGDELWAHFDALYVFDPFVVGAQARRIYEMRHDQDGSPDRGHGIAYSPQGQYLAFVERDDVGFNNVVALPLTCLPGDSLPSPAGDPQRLFPVRADAGIEGRGWTTGLDWSPDGRRLAASVAPLLVWQPGYRSWGTARIAVGELAYSYANGIELVSAAETNMHMVTSGPPAGQTDYSDERPSWGPSGVTAACDRVAFMRSSVMTLLDVPRAGYTSADCAVPAPKGLGKSASGFDWK